MTSKHEPLPPRLTAGDADTGAAMLLKKFERTSTPLPPQRAAWDRTLARMAGGAGRNRLSLGLAAACGIFAGVVGLQLVWSVRVRSRSVDAVGVVGGVRGQRDQARTDWVPGGTETYSVPHLATGDTVRGAAKQGTTSGGAPTVRHPANRVSTAAASVSVRPSPRIELGEMAVGLPFGPSELVGEAEAVLSPDGKAGAFVGAGAATIALAAGAIDLHVEKREAKTDHKFQVLAGAYRFTVLGTRFRVTRLGRSVKLAVSEGRVEVARGERVVAVIAGGQTWNSAGGEAAWPSRDRDGVAVPSDEPSQKPPNQPSASATTGSLVDSGPAVVSAPPRFIALATPSRAVAPASPPAPAPMTGATARPTVPTTPEAKRLDPRGVPPAPLTRAVSPAIAGMAPLSDCGIRARTDARRGLECYLLEARGQGLPAEVALYEAARLRRDVLKDPAGALESLTEHRRRFPSGDLKVEVDLSIAELLPDLGRYREALNDIEALLKSPRDVERRGELLLLRGHVLREGFHDWPAAERAYAEAVETGGARGRAADAGAFWRAVCLESMGRRDEAKRAYTSYLARSHPLQAAEAARRLKALLR